MGSDCQMISECCDWVQPAEAAVFERAINVDTNVSVLPLPKVPTHPLVCTKVFDNKNPEL